MALAAVLAWAGTGCGGSSGGTGVPAGAGAGAASVGTANGVPASTRDAQADASDLVGTWTNAGGARLSLRADRSLSAQGVRGSVRGGTSCTDTLTGRWAFYGPSDAKGQARPDARLTRGGRVDLADRAPDPASCTLSALVRRDGQALALCLVEDPDTPCSDEELLRPERSAGATATPTASANPSADDDDDDDGFGSRSGSKSRKSGGTSKKSSSSRKTRH